MLRCAACRVCSGCCSKCRFGGFFSLLLRQKALGMIWFGAWKIRGQVDSSTMHRVYAIGEAEQPSSEHLWTACCEYARGGDAMGKCRCSCETGREKEVQWCMVHASTGFVHSLSRALLLRLFRSCDTVNCLTSTVCTCEYPISICAL